jgi:hypothetical protein
MAGVAFLLLALFGGGKARYFDQPAVVELLEPMTRVT